MCFEKPVLEGTVLPARLPSPERCILSDAVRIQITLDWRER